MLGEAPVCIECMIEGKTQRNMTSGLLSNIYMNSKTTGKVATCKHSAEVVRACAWQILKRLTSYNPLRSSAHYINVIKSEYLSNNV